MKFRLLEIWIFLFFPIVALSQTRVAIGDFQNRTNWAFLDSWEQKIPEFLQSELSGSPDIFLVERGNLKSILKEQSLTMAGLVDSSTAQQVGHLLSAEYIIAGTVNRVGKWYRIDAKIINVNSGKIISEKVQSKQAASLDQMVKLLANNLAYQLTGKGKYETTIHLKKYPVGYYLAGTIAAGVTTGFLHKAYRHNLEDYHRAARLGDFDPPYNSANRFHKAQQLFAWVTGVGVVLTATLWIKNLTEGEILASRPPIVFYGLMENKGDFSVGFQISF